MPMIDIQRRHAEVFRIRLGDKGPNGQPRKLTEQIRVTAVGADIVQAFVEVYGGEITDFTEDRSRHRFQAYLPTTELSILVLPGHSMSQWWEKYKGSVCERRCDGVKEQKSGKRCMCPEEIEARVADRNACSPTTRINVLCPDVAGAGSGALVTHGLIAAETLPQSIAVAEAALTRGLMVPAVLRVVEHKGRNHFIVPQIEIVGISVNELTTGERALQSVSAPVIAIGSGRPRITPVPDDLPEAPVSSVRDQVSAVNEPKARPQRANAQVPIPSTGLKPGPRPARSTDDDVVDAEVVVEPASADDHYVLRQAVEFLEDSDKTRLHDWWKAQGLPSVKEHDALNVEECAAAMDFIDGLSRDVEARRTRAAQVAADAGTTVTKAQEIAARHAPSEPDRKTAAAGAE